MSESVLGRREEAAKEAVERDDFEYFLRRFGHMAHDYWKLAQNLVDGKQLCSYCEGTGNEFYSMYRACPECGGNGQMKMSPGFSALNSGSPSIDSQTKTS